MNRLSVCAIVVLLTASATTIACSDGKPGEPGPAGPNAPESVTGGNGDKPAEPGSGGGGGSSGAPGASSSGAPSASSSSGAPSTSSSSGDPPVTPTTIKTGNITVIQSSEDDETHSYTAIASFLEVPASAKPPVTKCTSTKAGDCELTACDLAGAAQPPAGEPKKAPTASDITITGGEAITLKADTKGLYTPNVGEAQLLQSAADFKIKAKGAEVPAFDKTVKAPSLVTVQTPEWTNPGELFNVDRAEDLPFTWTGGTVGDVQVTIASIEEEKSTTLVCKFAANKGTGTIPKAQLAKLVPSETASIQLNSITTQAFDQAGWKINVSATSMGRANVGGLTTGLAGVR